MTKNKTFLLDANVLIALTTPDHSLHSRALAWFSSVDHFATCPITQGALMRFHLRWGVGASVQTGKGLLQRIARHPLHVFWTDEANYLDLPEKGVIGHRQVTDAYLVLLAREKGGALSSMDDALVAMHSNVVLI